MRAWASVGLTVLAALGFAIGGLLTAWGLLLIALLIAHDAGFGSGSTRYLPGALLLAAVGAALVGAAFGCTKAAIRVRIPPELRMKQ